MKLTPEIDKPPVKTEQNVYSSVYHVLLIGMLASSALFVLGVARALMRHAYFPLTQDWVRSQYDLGTVLRGLARLDPAALMLAATVLLILTPVARVLVSIYAFYVDRDRRYVVVTSIVLAIMLLTVLLSHLGLQ